ncbi:hypothetical protein YC2023_104945 [Brassica napus]
MAISLLDGGSPQRNGISLGGACRPMKTAFFCRFLSSTKENSEIPSWWLFSEEAKRRFTIMNALG